MFGKSLFNEFEGDPFFAGSSEHMRDLNQNFGGDPYAGSGRSLEEGRSNQRDRRSDGERDGDRNRAQDISLFNPGFGFGNMFGHMDSMMKNMQENMKNSMRSFETVANDPNGHSFQQASFMSYTNNGEGPPQVYQTSTSTRQAPGGLKETRKALRDTRADREKMSIGHHINDRGHLVERNKNIRTGEIDERQNYLNLGEADAPAFDQEFREKIDQHKHYLGSDRPGRQSDRDLDYRPDRNDRRALPSSTDSGAQHWGRTPDRERGYRDNKYREDKHREDRNREDKYREDHGLRDRK